MRTRTNCGLTDWKQSMNCTPSNSLGYSNPYSSIRFPIDGESHWPVPFHQSLAILFFVLVYYLAQGASINASPNPSTDNRSLDSNPCTDLTHCQTVWNITWTIVVPDAPEIHL